VHSKADEKGELNLAHGIKNGKIRMKSKKTNKPVSSGETVIVFRVIETTRVGNEVRAYVNYNTWPKKI